MNKKQRAQAAQRIMEQEIVKEAFELLEKRILEDWKFSKPEENEKRYAAWLKIGLLDEFKQHLKLAIQDGDING